MLQHLIKPIQRVSTAAKRYVRILARCLVLGSVFLGLTPKAQATGLDTFYNIAEGYAIVKVTNTAALPISTTNFRTATSSLNAILDRFDVYRYKQIYGPLRTDSLKDLYNIYFGVGTFVALKAALDSVGLFDYIVHKTPYQVLDCANPITPNDYGYTLTNSNSEVVNLFQLDLIDAKCAWSLVGDAAPVVVGIIDTEFDTDHEDLQNKFVSVRRSGAPNPGHHGTKVAGGITVSNDNGKGISAIGRYTSMAAYEIFSKGRSVFNVWDNFVLAAENPAVKVINVSIDGLAGSPQEIFYIKAVINKGKVICVGAGNYDTGLVKKNHTLISNIPGVIQVTGIDKNNLHQWTNCYHNEYVDICAPTNQVITTSSSKFGTDKYAITAGASSYATGVVSGVCALIFSMQPCLIPADVEDIIKRGADPVADASLYPGGLGAGKINAYNSVLEARDGFEYTAPLTTIWESSVNKAFKTLTIPSGVTLTVQGKLRMYPGGKIIIKQGGKLILDGGNITSLCPTTLWQGIEVWGNSAQCQGAKNTQNILYQGTLIVKNNALIENARTAVTVWRPNFWNTTGGIVQATGSYFKNNRKAIEMMSYKNKCQGNNAEIDNESYIRQCNFLTTQNLNESVDFDCFVSLWEVKGVYFSGCNFDNFNPQVAAHTSLRGRGITSLNSSFKVGGTCKSIPLILTTVTNTPCPTGTLNRTRFAGLQKGISAGDVSLVKNFRAMYCDFTENEYGIKSDGVNNIEVFQNTFNIGKYRGPSSPTPPWTYGLFINMGTAYRVEENSLKLVTNASTLTTNSTGIVCWNTGEGSNVIFKNTITDIQYGLLADLKNASVATPNQGLQFLCNNLINNQKAALQLNAGGKIKINQGDPNKPAGNSFPNLGVTQSFDIYNASPSIFRYYHATTGIKQIPLFTTPNVSKISTPGTPNCASTLTNGIYGGGNDRFILKSDLQTNLGSFYSGRASIASMIDQGNTTQLSTDVVASTTASNLFATVSVVSPWISDKVMRQVVDKNLLSMSQLKTLFQANPDVLAQRDFLDYLYYHPTVHFSTAGLDTIKGYALTTSTRSTWESNVGIAINEATRCVDALSGYYLDDTLSSSVDSFRWVLTQLPSLHHKYALAESYVGDSMYSSAASVLSSLRDSFEMDWVDSFEYDDFVTFKDFQINIANSGRNLLQLDSAEEMSLLPMAITLANGRVGVRVRNLLEFGYGYQFQHGLLPTTHNYEGNWSQASYIKEGAKLESSYELYPNPSDGILTLRNKSEVPSLPATLIIVNTAGKEVYTTTSSTLPVTIDLQSIGLTSGNYLLRILTRASSQTLPFIYKGE